MGLTLPSKHIRSTPESCSRLVDDRYREGSPASQRGCGAGVLPVEVLSNFRRRHEFAHLKSFHRPIAHGPEYGATERTSASRLQSSEPVGTGLPGGVCSPSQPATAGVRARRRRWGGRALNVMGCLAVRIVAGSERLLCESWIANIERPGGTISGGQPCNE